MQTLQIDPEFQAIAPPLTPDELATLEASLLAEGCREPIDVWNGVIVDGHNRYALCRKHSIEFKVVERTFQSHDHAIVWIVQKQFGRRNITQAQRENMAIQHMKPALTRIGLEKKSAGGVEARSSDAGNNVSVESTETLLSGDKQAGPHVTDAVLAKASGTSESGIQRTNYIRKNAPETLLNKYLAGEVSRDRAYKLTNALLNLPEADRNRAAEVCIDHDEKARILVRLHKSQVTDPDSNGTYEEVLRTGGFHYGDDLERWCDFGAAGVSEIENGLKSLAKHHARMGREEAARAARAQQAIPARIVHADAMSWLNSLPPKSIKLLLTDPPYMTDVDDIAVFAGEWIPLALSRLADDGRAYIFTGSYPDEIYAYLAAIREHGDLGGSQLLVWHYTNTLGPSPKMQYKTAHQTIHYLYGKEAPPLNAPQLTEATTVHDMATPASTEGGNMHRWQKPIALAERFVLQASKPGDLLVDPFAGTGTFLLAASSLGRPAVGSEIDPGMIEMAIRRGCRRE
ncbi:MAG: DNA modification methylase [Bryobacterales bacterium]|nr:DNA modification methylase [Bryobacterales bacterium]